MHFFWIGRKIDAVRNVVRKPLNNIILHDNIRKMYFDLWLLCGLVTLFKDVSNVYFKAVFYE